MVEKWDIILEPPEPLELPGLPGPFGPLGPRDPQYLRIPWIAGTLKTSGPSDLLGSQDLRTLGKLPLPFENQSLNTQKL